MEAPKKNQTPIIMGIAALASLILGFRLAASYQGLEFNNISGTFTAITTAISDVLKHPFSFKFTKAVFKDGLFWAFLLFMCFFIPFTNSQTKKWKWDAYFDVKRKKSKHRPKGLKIRHDKYSAENINEMIGLDNVKQEINQLIDYSKVQQMRKRKGLSASELNLNLVFYGNPGTGKTVVARYLARELKKHKILKIGQMFEADRSLMVAQGPGQTGPLVHEVVESALGGVLFIDEAYTLTMNRDEYGIEAVNTLLKLMEDYKEQLVVIVAGYDDLMEDFIASNPGLQSRFTKHIHFRDYTAEELLEIFKILCKKRDYILHEKAETALLQFFQTVMENKPVNFSNGRYVRNVFEDIIAGQAMRVSKQAITTKALLMEITTEDIANFQMA